MSEIFGTTYSDLYDVTYATKDYEAECDLLERLFGEGGGRPRSIVDLGCGTGGHAVPLAQRGYEVVGVDRSPGMLANAARKASAAGVNVELVEQDLRSLDLGRTFDAAVMLFAVIGYQLENDALVAALGSVRRHLEPGGQFVFDCWYGPAVLADRPEQRTKLIEHDGSRLIRSSSATLDHEAQVCEVSIDIWELRADTLVSETHERHGMRFFFRRELELLLERAGFRLDLLAAFDDVSRAPAIDDWIVVARATAV